jgi:hypothetical protein
MSETTAAIVADELHYEHVPHFDTFSAACWAVEDTIRRVSPDEARA